MTETTTHAIENFHVELHNLIKDLINDGLKVYAPKKGLDPKLTYFYYTDGTRIGYAQFDRLNGLCFHTVHIPSTLNGAGAQASDGWDYFDGIILHAREGLSYVPSWWKYGAVEKYRDFAHFQKKHWTELLEVIL